MTQKPKIQYIGQFYVHGSEARQLQLMQQKQAKERAVLEHRLTVRKIYVDPVAVVAIAVAVVMLVVMVIGAVQIRNDWEEYRQMSDYVSRIKTQNAEKTSNYRSKFDLEEVRTKALALGLVPVDQIQTSSVQVILPEPEPEVNRIDQVKQYLEDLFA